MKKILVVEDEYYARKSIVKILQESDLDIQVCGEAENGMKAIELLEEYKDIALVITDIQMQKMGGLELASYLHKHIPEIDVLILTAFENFDYAREALRYNVKDYIVKPIYKENLLPPVKKVLEKQEEKSRNQEKIKNYYQWEATKNYFPVKTIVAHEELYKEFFSYNAIHQEEKFCIVVMQEEELVTDVELVNRIIQEKYRGFIKDFFFSKINEEYVMLLSGIECMDNELIVQEKVESMLSYFCTCKHMNITMGVGLVYSSKEKIYQSYNEAFYNTDHEGYECVPTDEEYIRSCQFGFFNSLSRCHGKTPREPWNFGEKAEKIFKKFNDIRHLLLPYLYSTTYKTHLSDIPVIRPVVMEYPEDRSARNVELEYFLGDSLLVVPVFDQEDEIDVYLPNGQWIDLFTHERIKGGRWVKRKIELDKIPVFIRQNKMIPMLTKIPENIEEKYENLDVILFCEDEIRDTYIDDGNVQNLKAKIEEGTLFINTDMDASYFTVYAEKCLDNAVVNGQNWEIKKEKEGYYKIALEK